MLIKGAAVLGEDFIFHKRDIAVEGGVFRAAGCNRGEILDGTGLFLLWTSTRTARQAATTWTQIPLPSTPSRTFSRAAA